MPYREGACKQEPGVGSYPTPTRDPPRSPPRPLKKLEANPDQLVLVLVLRLLRLAVAVEAAVLMFLSIMESADDASTAAKVELGCGRADVVRSASPKRDPSSASGTFTLKRLPFLQTSRSTHMLLSAAPLIMDATC